MGSLAGETGPPGLLPPRTQGVFLVILLLDLAAGVGAFRGRVSHPVVLVLDEQVRVVVVVVTVGHGTRGLWPGMPAVFRHDALAYIRADRYGERGKCRNAQLRAARFGSGMGLGKGMGRMAAWNALQQYHNGGTRLASDWPGTPLELSGQGVGPAEGRQRKQAAQNG